MHNKQCPKNTILESFLSVTSEETMPRRIDGKLKSSQGSTDLTLNMASESSLERRSSLPHEEQEEIKRNIWKNFGRVISGRSTDLSAHPTPTTPKTLEHDLSIKTEIHDPIEQLKSYIGLDNTSHWSDWKSEVFVMKHEKSKKSLNSTGTQTEKIKTKEIGFGGIERTSVKIQTENEEEIDKNMKEHPAAETVSYPPSLYDFIARVKNDVLEALKENIYRNNFDEFDKFEDELTYEKPKTEQYKYERYELISSKKPILLHHLRSNKIEEKVQAVTVSWSPSGTQLAVGYGHSAHDGFCRHHSSPLTIWSLVPSLLRNGPLLEILFENCTTVVEFHPKYNNLIAFTLYTGEVGIIDLNGNEKSLEALENEGRSRKRRTYFEFKQGDAYVMFDYSCHAMETTSLRWIQLNRDQLQKIVTKNKNPSSFLVISSSFDGFIAVWSLDTTRSHLVLERRVVVHSDLIPDKFKKSNWSTFLSIKQLPIQSFDSFRDDPFHFVCTTFGSYIFHGTLLGSKKYGKFLRIKSFVLKLYQDHDQLENEDLNASKVIPSDVYDSEAVFIQQEIDRTMCVANNPFNQFLFAYVTLNGLVSVRSTKYVEGEPIFKTYLPLSESMDIKWSPIRSMTFGTINKKSAFIYDLLIHEFHSLFEAEHESNCLAFSWSKAEANYFATTTADGFLNIWKLPEDLADYDYAEVDDTNAYAEFLNYSDPSVSNTRSPKNLIESRFSDAIQGNGIESEAETDEDDSGESDGDSGNTMIARNDILQRN